jgi:hypothetical protein
VHVARRVEEVHADEAGAGGLGQALGDAPIAMPLVFEVRIACAGRRRRPG